MRELEISMQYLEDKNSDLEKMMINRDEEVKRSKEKFKKKEVECERILLLNTTHEVNSELCKIKNKKVSKEVCVKQEKERKNVNLNIDRLLLNAMVMACHRTMWRLENEQTWSFFRKYIVDTCNLFDNNYVIDRVNEALDVEKEDIIGHMDGVDCLLKEKGCEKIPMWFLSGAVRDWVVERFESCKGSVTGGYEANCEMDKLGNGRHKLVCYTRLK